MTALGSRLFGPVLAAALAVGCTQPATPDREAETAAEAPADAADLVARARAETRRAVRAFELVESAGDEVTRRGRVTVYPTEAQPQVDLSWNRGGEITRVQSDGATVTVKDPSGAVRYSPWSEAGATLFSEEAGRLLPAALDPTTFASYGATLEPGPDAETLLAVAGLPGGGSWQVAISTSDWLPEWVSFQATAEGPIERLELELADAADAVAVAALALEPAAGEEATPYYAGPAPGERAPDVEFAIADGTTVRLSELTGQVVVVDFWATWCAPCRPAMRKLEELFREHRESGLAVYGLRLFDSGDASEYLSDLGISYPIGDGAPFAAPYAVETYGLPTLYVIGRDGRIAKLIVGFSAQNEVALVEAIESALGG